MQHFSACKQSKKTILRAEDLEKICSSMNFKALFTSCSIPAKCHAEGVIVHVTPADRKLGSHAYSRPCSDLSRLVEKFEPLQH